MYTVYDGIHFLCVDQDINQAGKMEKCTMREKRRGMREVGGGKGCQLALLSRNIWKHLRLH